MGYKQIPTVRIDLAELGDNNGVPFFVDIKNPKLLTFEEKMSFAKVGKVEDEIEKVKAMKEVTKDFIVAWNLIDMETEESINPKDEKALDKVPSEVVESIMKKIGESSKQGDAETKNS